MWNAAIEPCQTAIASTNTTTRRRPLAGAAQRDVHAGSSSRQEVLATLAQQLAHGGDELEEVRVLARLDVRAGAAGRRRRPGDPARPRAHHDDPRGEEHGLGDRVRDEDDGRAERLPDREQLEVQPLARHLVERAERLVHQQQRRLERERARDRDALLHAARQLPRMVVAEGAELDEVEHLARRARGAGRGPSRASRAAVRCSSRRCASRRARRPGRRSRSRGRSRAWCAGLPLTVDAARSRLDQVADHAQQRRLPAAGRADQRHELAGCELEVDVLERRDVPARERLRDAAETETTKSLMRRAPVRGARSASRRRRRRMKKGMPSAAATMFVAHSSCGSIE